MWCGPIVRLLCLLRLLSQTCCSACCPRPACCLLCSPPVQALLAKHGKRLFGVESRKPLNEFDVLGFSLSYELGGTNILEMLRQSGVPVTWEASACSLSLSSLRTSRSQLLAAPVAARARNGCQQQCQQCLQKRFPSRSGSSSARGDLRLASLGAWPKAPSFKPPSDALHVSIQHLLLLSSPLLPGAEGGGRQALGPRPRLLAPHLCWRPNCHVQPRWASMARCFGNSTLLLSGPTERAARLKDQVALLLMVRRFFVLSCSMPRQGRAPLVPPAAECLPLLLPNCPALHVFHNTLPAAAEPFAMFFDFVALGDGEESLAEIGQ